MFFSLNLDKLQDCRLKTKEKLRLVLTNFIQKKRIGLKIENHLEHHCVKSNLGQSSISVVKGKVINEHYIILKCCFMLEDFFFK